MREEVVFWSDSKLRISSRTLKQMKHKALHNGKNKFRYCFHENEDSIVHEMLFTNTKDCYFRPHSHNDDELQVVIAGKMYVVFFDDNGKIIESFLATKRNNSIYRINKGQWHMNLPISKTITIFEVKKGPFQSNSNYYPKWAPDNSNIKLIKKYINGVKRDIRKMRRI